MHLDVDGIGDVRLRDVAAVELTDNAGETYAKVNGNDGVVLSFQKQSTASTADVSGKINDAIEKLQQENPDLHITPLMDQGDYIDLVVSSVLSNLLWLSLIHIFRRMVNAWVICSKQLNWSGFWDAAWKKILCVVPILLPLMRILRHILVKRQSDAANFTTE